MKIMSYNVVHFTFKDILFIWRNRYKKVVSFIKKEDPDILGMQEVTKKAKRYLTKHLDEYNVIGLSRHSMPFTNECTPLLIKKEYEITSSNTYSLSHNINKLGTKIKADNFPRICVVAHIQDKKNKYLVINTHIDNSSGPNKKRLLGIYEDIINREKEDDEYIILMGDYNMTLLNDDLKKFSQEYIDPFKEYKYGSFVPNPTLIPLDHIFIDKRLKYKNDKIYRESNNDYFISDHYPISCEVEKG